MPLNIAQRGAVLRHLQLGNVFSRPTRVAAIHSHARRVSLAAGRRFANPITRTEYQFGAVSQGLIKSYATVGRPKGSTGKAKPKATEAAGDEKKSGKTAKSKTSGAKKDSTKEEPKKKRKVLTDKQKEAKKVKEQRELLKTLKETALQPPKKASEHKWTLAVQDKLVGVDRSKFKGTEVFQEGVRGARNVTPEEDEKFTQQAELNKAANAAAYKEWIKSHTPLQIKEANHARERLEKITGKYMRPLKDDRLVKRPLTAYIAFYTDRVSGGDFKHLKPEDITSHIAREWRAMTDTEKEKYVKISEADRKRYAQEHLEVYGTEAPFTQNAESESS
ncbi:hypothetical protein ASPWEDRAFT_65783 [Aspergillus wentii DTO 134E9]|uniref:HMG box domain-containing protein n=1 Tax=Aspergillus wentii DTO 134E9 TaxID=1073089 RepID=A0A1L9RVE0_ASPWE|nr:uncharacterized protein ASPWEDRAFT_65783 [Aspergillus wentii DTO 134E9]KAI9928758.1 hypothetical protein MW887_001976 [Aspergillus wentii]OJJ38853.1 hypothetical protein ASPWEDRAFT_65783 [Aspergillus wentii DTO 134E9]